MLRFVLRLLALPALRIGLQNGGCPMRGTNPDWANLPRRKCDDCGKNYKPKQPLHRTKKDGTPIEMRGFCSGNCRKSYHKHGGAYRKLKAEMLKLVYKEIEAFKHLQSQLIGNAIQGWIHDAEQRASKPAAQRANR